MTDNWATLYEEGANNAQILATASEIFFATTNAKQQTSKFNQSFNALEVNNDNNNITLYVDLDGLTTRRRIIFPRSSLIIEPKDGIFFNQVKVTNSDGANNAAANTIRLNARIAARVGA